MATKSILKTITIRDPASAAALANALENASGKSAKQVPFSRGFSHAGREEIQKMFREKP